MTQQERDLDALITDLRDLSERNRADAARMREIDALVSGLAIERLAEANYNRAEAHDFDDAWEDQSQRLRDKHIASARFYLTAFAAALLTDGAVSAGRAAYDSADAISYDVDFKGGIRAAVCAAIRAAGVEPVERTAFACSGLEVPTKTADELAQMTKRAEAAEAEVSHRGHVNDKAWTLTEEARAEADALRAEVAALRGLPESLAIRVHGLSLKQALNTVPPAKVADAVRPTVGEAAFLPSEHHAMCNCDGCLAKTPKPEAAGLEPLARVAEALDFDNFYGDEGPVGNSVLEGLIDVLRCSLLETVARVNELSAIAKRGGL
jgi:hypothetical protein